MLLPVGPPSHIVPYRPVNLLYGIIDARACSDLASDLATRITLRDREYPSARTYATPRFFPRPLVCRFSPTSCSPFYHLYLDVLRVRPAVLWPAVLSRFRGDAPRYCRHSICPARSALYVVQYSCLVRSYRLISKFCPLTCSKHHPLATTARALE